jgi:hypothetical protein
MEELFKKSLKISNLFLGDVHDLALIGAQAPTGIVSFSWR